MEKIGEVFGWIAAVCYFISVANFFVKRILRRGLPNCRKRTHGKGISAFMKLIVKISSVFWYDRRCVCSASPLLADCQRQSILFRRSCYRTYGSHGNFRIFIAYRKRAVLQMFTVP